jgi:hypothetical protein
MRPSLYVSNIFKGNVMRPSEAQEIIEEKIEIIRTMLTNEDMVKLKSLGKEKEKKEFGAFVFENFDIIVAYINNPAEINMTDNSKIDLIKLGANAPITLCKRNAGKRRKNLFTTAERKHGKSI